MDLKVIEPIKNYLKEFKTPDEFNLFYQTKKDELNKLTTHKLNKMYHISGYRITKIQGEIMLKKWNEVEKHDLHEQVELLKEDVKKVKDTLNNLIEYINRH